MYSVEQPPHCDLLRLIVAPSARRKLARDRENRASPSGSAAGRASRHHRSAAAEITPDCRGRTSLGRDDSGFLPPDGVGLPALSGGFFPEHKCQISLARPLALVFISAIKMQHSRHSWWRLGGGACESMLVARARCVGERILWQKMQCETLRPAPRLHGEVAKRRFRAGRPKIALLRLPYYINTAACHLARTAVGSWRIFATSHWHWH